MTEIQEYTVMELLLVLFIGSCITWILYWYGE